MIRASSETSHFDAVVIGAGDAGLEVVSGVLSTGGTAALIYLDPFLGTCLNTGCNPSKFLIERARIIHEARRGADMGITFGEPRVDMAAIIREKNELLRKERESAFHSARSEKRLTLVNGRARFISPGEVQVGERRVTGEHVFIATGTRPAIPAIDGMDLPNVLTNESLMNLEEIPDRLAIIGGGYVACELGQAYRRFGSEVTIVQRSDRLCPREEPEISDELLGTFEEDGIEVLFESRVRSVSAKNESLQVRMGGIGAQREIDASHVLVATGRRPNTDALDLRRGGIETDERGFVLVSDELETTAPNTWAVGDVNGRQPFTRIGQIEGQLAFNNAFGNNGRESMERRALPHAIFTDPEVGSVGLTEAQARNAGFELEARSYPLSQTARARLANRDRGVIKFVVERGEERRILGCHVAGHGGAELVYSAVLVMEAGGSIDGLGHTTGTFPTMQEGVEGAARAMSHALMH